MFRSLFRSIDIQILSILGILAFLIKIIPFWNSGLFAFGHDIGFYRRYIIQPFVSFPNTPVPGLDHTVYIPRMILDVWRVLLPYPDFALFTCYVIFSLLGTIGIYKYSSYYLSKRLSLYATVLYVFSAIQFLTYQNFFFKETIALPLFLATLLFLERKSYFPAVIFGVLVILTQQTTSVILICIIAVGFIIRTILLKEFSIAYIFSGTAILASYLFLHPHVAQKIVSPPVGIFLSQTEYILWSIPLIILTLVGVQNFFKSNKQYPILFATIAVPLAFILFHLPFYNRIYVFTDMFLIIPAAYGIDRIYNLHTHLVKHSGKIVIYLMSSVYFFMLLYTIKVQPPLVDVKTQQSLSQLSSLPSASSIITSPRLLPWVQGWSLSKVYAPGNLKEPHSLSDWSMYWTHQNTYFEKDFLSSFPKPTYVFIDSVEKQYRPDCAKEIRENLFSIEPCQ
jgi:hypothetical protein